MKIEDFIDEIEVESFLRVSFESVKFNVSFILRGSVSGRHNGEAQKCHDHIHHEIHLGQFFGTFVFNCFQTSTAKLSLVSTSYCYHNLAFHRHNEVLFLNNASYSRLYLLATRHWDQDQEIVAARKHSKIHEKLLLKVLRQNFQNKLKKFTTRKSC